MQTNNQNFKRKKKAAEDKKFILRNTGLKIQNPKVYIFVKSINILHIFLYKIKRSVRPFWNKQNKIKVRFYDSTS